MPTDLAGGPGVGDGVTPRIRRDRRVVSTLAEQLTARGHDVTLFAVGGSSSAARLVTFLTTPHPADPAAFADEIFHTPERLSACH